MLVLSCGFREELTVRILCTLTLAGLRIFDTTYTLQLPKRIDFALKRDLNPDLVVLVILQPSLPIEAR